MTLNLSIKQCYAECCYVIPIVIKLNVVALIISVVEWVQIQVKSSKTVSFFVSVCGDE